MSPLPKKRKRISKRAGPRSFKLVRGRGGRKIKDQKQKPTLKPSDLRKRKLVKRRNSLILKLAIVVFLVLCLLFSFWIVLHADGMRIQTIDVRSEGALDANDIEAYIVDAMGERKSALFPGNNTFFIPITAIERSLKETFLRIDEINILRKGFSELIVVIEERSPELIYCEGASAPEGVHYSGDCFFADSSGIVYSTAPYIPRSEFKIIYFHSIPPAQILGTTPLSTEELSALTLLVETLESEEVGVRAVSLLDKGILEIETEEAYVLLVAVKDDYTDDLERFFSALDADIFDGERSLEDVYQFDLRYGRKVFYKYKEDTESGAE